MGPANTRGRPKGVGDDSANKGGSKGEAGHWEEEGDPLRLWPRANHLGVVHPIADGGKIWGKLRGALDPTQGSEEDVLRGVGCRSARSARQNPRSGLARLRVAGAWGLEGERERRRREQGSVEKQTHGSPTVAG